MTMKYRDKKIGVLMGGLSAEREISLRSGNACLNALLKKGYNAVGIDVGRDIPMRLKEEGIEVAYIALHGRFGEDGTVQGILEVMGIPYTGSGVTASSVAMDKALTKDVISAKGVRTPRYAVVKSLEEGMKAGMPLPLVVKPVSEGSTIGISIVREAGELKVALEEGFRHDRTALMEEFVSGRELTVGILDGKPLPPIEVRPKSGFYDFKSKYTAGMTEYICPAAIDEDIADRCRTAAKACYTAVGCSGAARVDMILDGDSPSIIEINTIPGMTETSLLPKAAACEGMSFEDLVERILDGAGLKI